MRRNIINISLLVILLTLCITACGEAASTSDYSNTSSKTTLVTELPDTNATNDSVEEATDTVEEVTNEKVEDTTNDAIKDVTTDVVEDTINDTVNDTINEATDDTAEAEPVVEDVVVPDFESIDAIAAIGGLKSTVEKDYKECIVYVDTDHNPYDVEYDYGDTYNAYVDACDWSLVFDADYYIETFPTLALLYNNDKDLLLEHFATVGIHEGRQGSKKFNVGSYMSNCDSDIAKAFGNNYECYYIYYLLNYDNEKSVDVAPTKNTEIQYKVILTAMQEAELKHVNEYRVAAGVAPIEYNEALAEIANYRAYINVVEGWDAHEWMHAEGKMSSLYKYLNLLDKSDYYMTSYSENNVTTESAFNERLSRDNVIPKYLSYANSQSHYEAMVNAKFVIFGTSSRYYGSLPENKHSDFKSATKYTGATFDCFCQY